MRVCGILHRPGGLTEFGENRGLRGFDRTLRDFSEPGDDGSHPQLPTAVQEQLGLQLKAGKGTIRTLVIDHIEKPSEN
jgi:hypothetical protein